MLSRQVMLLLLAFFVFKMASALCWFPDGVTQDPDGYPCNSSATASHCCRTFEACLSGGACYTQFDSQLYRRSCTDKTFTDSNCPQECKTTAPSGGDGIIQCTDGPHPTYCCQVPPDAGTSCCSNASFGFIPGGIMGVLDGAGVLNTPSASTVTTASFTSTSSSSTGTSSATASTSSSITSSPTAATPTSSPSAASSHTGRTVGLAVGISLGVCAIAAVLGIWFFFRRKLDRERIQTRELESRIGAAGRVPGKPELAADKKNAQEMDSSARQELDTKGRAPYEVGSNTYRHEAM